MDVRRAVAAVLLLGLLVGCSEDEPKADPPEPTGSASTSPTPPAATDEAREPTAAGARAFVRYWIASFNYAMQTGDTVHFRRLSSNQCEGCLKIVRLIEEIYGPGGYVDSDGWRITRFVKTSLAGNSSASARALIALSPELIHRAGAAKVDRRTGGRATVTFSLARGNDAWLVSDVVQGDV